MKDKTRKVDKQGDYMETQDIVRKLPLDGEIDELIAETKSATQVNKEELHLVSDAELSSLEKKNRRIRDSIDIATDRIHKTLHHLLENGLHHQATKLIFNIELPLIENRVGKPVLSYKVENNS